MFVGVSSAFFVVFIRRVSLLILAIINGDHNSVAGCLSEQNLFGQQDAGSRDAIAQAAQAVFSKA